MEINSNIQADGDISIMGQLISSVMSAAPLVVASSLLVVGLNSNFLEGKRASDFVPTSRNISVGTGLSGGGNLGSDVSLFVNFGTTPGTVAQGNDQRIANGQIAHERWIGSPYVSDINNAINSGIYTYTAPATNAPSLYGTILTVVGASTSGNAASGAFVNQLIFTDSNDFYFRRGGGGAPVAWGAMQQVWTSSKFSQANINNWNTAYSWGNHALAGYTSNTGTVTSVGLSAPTGFNVTSSPVTSSGSLSFVLHDDYFLPLKQSKTAWDQAYNWGNHATAGYVTSASLNNYVPISRIINTGAGLLGGGNLSGNITLSANIGTGSGQVAAGNDQRILNGQTSYDRWAGGTGTGQDFATRAGISGITGWEPGAAGRPGSLYGTIFRFIAGTSTGEANGGSWANELLAGLDQNWYLRTGGGNGNGSGVNWNPIYQIWTTRQFDSNTANNWNTAYSWGNHSAAGYTKTNGTVTSVGLSAPTGFNVTSSPVTSSGNVSFEINSSYFLPLVISKTAWDQAYNWGNHAGQYVPNGRTITINGNTQNLADNRSWTIPTGVSGSGNVNYYAKFTNGGTSIGSSKMWESGDEVLFSGGYLSQIYKINANEGVFPSRVVVGNATFYNSAVLAANSTSQGFLPPRMTTAQRNAISNPEEGLIVYSADTLGVTEGVPWIYSRNSSGSIFWHRFFA